MQLLKCIVLDLSYIFALDVDYFRYLSIDAKLITTQFSYSNGKTFFSVYFSKYLRYWNEMKLVQLISHVFMAVSLKWLSFWIYIYRKWTIFHRYFLPTSSVLLSCLKRRSIYTRIRGLTTQQVTSIAVYVLMRYLCYVLFKSEPNKMFHVCTFCSRYCELRFEFLGLLLQESACVSTLQVTELSNLYFSKF